MDVERIARLVARNVLRQESAQLLRARSVQCPSSFVHRLEFSIDGATKAVFVKLPHDNGPKHDIFAERLRLEFEMTQRVYSAFPECHELKTVAPAGFLDEVNGLVTWEIPGKSLQDVINGELRFRIGAPPPRLLHLCELAGQWLHKFHSLDLAIEGDLREPLTNYFKWRLETLERAAGSKVPTALAAGLSKKLQGWLAQSLEGPSAKTFFCHNDFSPHNIIVNGEGIGVLDFSFAGLGLPAFDVACFWHKLEDLKTSPLHSANAIGILQRTFLGGYGSGFDLTRPDAKLGVARVVLSKMITLLETHSVRPDDWIDGRRRLARYLTLLESGFEVKAT